MRNVRFSSEETISLKPTAERGLVGFLIARKVVRTKTQANVLMLFITLVCVAIIVFLRVDFSDETNNRPATEAELQMVGSPGEVAPVE